jgi:hypothetical protein
MLPAVFVFAALGTPGARAVTFAYYTITFDGTDAPTAAFGTVLTFDASNGLFTTPTFTLIFEGDPYTMALSNNPQADFPTVIDDNISWVVSITGPLVIEDGSTGYALYGSTTDPGPVSAESGLATLSPAVAIPEPATEVMILLGFLCIYLLSRRLRNEHRPEAT